VKTTSANFLKAIPLLFSLCLPYGLAAQDTTATRTKTFVIRKPKAENASATKEFQQPEQNFQPKESIEAIPRRKGFYTKSGRLGDILGSNANERKSRRKEKK